MESPSTFQIIFPIITFVGGIMATNIAGIIKEFKENKYIKDYIIAWSNNLVMHLYKSKGEIDDYRKELKNFNKYEPNIISLLHFDFTLLKGIDKKDVTKALCLNAVTDTKENIEIIHRYFILIDFIQNAFENYIDVNRKIRKKIAKEISATEKLINKLIDYLQLYAEIQVNFKNLKTNLPDLDDDMRTPSFYRNVQLQIKTYFKEEIEEISVELQQKIEEIGNSADSLYFDLRYANALSSEISEKIDFLKGLLSIYIKYFEQLTLKNQEWVILESNYLNQSFNYKMLNDEIRFVYINSKYTMDAQYLPKEFELQKITGFI